MAKAQALKFPDLDEVLGILDAGVERVIANAQENIAKTKLTVAEVRKRSGDVRELTKSISASCHPAVVPPTANPPASGKPEDAGETRRPSTPDGQR